MDQGGQIKLKWDAEVSVPFLQLLKEFCFSAVTALMFYLASPSQTRRIPAQLADANHQMLLG